MPDVTSSVGRKKGHTPIGIILDEKKQHPDSCGLRVMIIDGGAGLQEIICCGHSLTLKAMRELKFGHRGVSSDEVVQPAQLKAPSEGHHGTA